MCFDGRTCYLIGVVGEEIASLEAWLTSASAAPAASTDRFLEACQDWQPRTELQRGARQATEQLSRLLQDAKASHLQRCPGWPDVHRRAWRLQERLGWVCEALPLPWPRPAAAKEKGRKASSQHAGSRQSAPAVAPAAAATGTVGAAATPAAATAAAAVCTDQSLLSLVWEYLGMGYWLYVAGTSPGLLHHYGKWLWRRSLPDDYLYLPDYTHTTSVSAAAQSPSALQWGLEHGLDAFLRERPRAGAAIGSSASVTTLEVALRAGVPAGPALAGAIAAGNAAVVAHLHGVLSGAYSATPPAAAAAIGSLGWLEVCITAAEAGRHESILPWVAQLPAEQVRREWPAWYLHDLCCAAALWRQREALEWLMEHGAAVFGHALAGPGFGDDISGTLGAIHTRCCSVRSFDCRSVARTVMEAAVMSGDVAAVQWLHAAHWEWYTERCLPLAAWSGELAMVQHLLSAPARFRLPPDTPFLWSQVGSSRFPSAAVTVVQLLLSSNMLHVSASEGAQVLEHVLGREFSAARRCEIAECLLSWGAPWPAGVTAATLADWPCNFKGPQLLWALGRGALWGDWSAELCAKVGISCHHEQLVQLGCPCTCRR